MRRGSLAGSGALPTAGAPRSRRDEPSWHGTPAPRWWRITRATLIWVVSFLLLGVIVFLVWANTPMPSERAPFDAVMANPEVHVADVGDAIVMTPTDRASGVGLVFIPGARVDPYAYLWKLSGVVGDDGLTVVVTKPTLNLAFFDRRPLSTFTSAAPNVHHWYVGGHSLGGVRACQYGETDDVRGIVFFGSYCANDVSSKPLRVLSIGGSRDGLSTPEQIAGAAHLLPGSARFLEIQGMDHAQFGDYGPQPGDNPPTITDRQARARLTAALDSFFADGR